MVKRLSLLAIVALLFMMIGCGGGGGSTDTRPTVLFVNASADAGNLDFRMDDSGFATGLVYAVSAATLSTIDFKGPDVDGWDVSLHTNPGGTEIDRQAIVFNQNTDNLIIAHGIRNYPAGEPLKRLRFNTFTFDRKSPNGNKAKLIIYHGLELGPGLSTPQVVFKSPGQNSLYTTPPIDPGGNAVITVDSGNQTFDVQRQGTDGVFVTVTQSLQAGSVYLVLISGIDQDPTPANQAKVTFIQLPGKL